MLLKTINLGKLSEFVLSNLVGTLSSSLESSNFLLFDWTEVEHVWGVGVGELMVIFKVFIAPAPRPPRSNNQDVYVQDYAAKH